MLRIRKNKKWRSSYKTSKLLAEVDQAPSGRLLFGEVQICLHFKNINEVKKNTIYWVNASNSCRKDRKVQKRGGGGGE